MNLTRTSTTTTTTMKRDDIGYHHFSLTFNPDEVNTRFQDVRFVLVAGSAHRAEGQAKFLAENLFNASAINNNHKHEFCKLTEQRSRFALFKVGPVLIGEHGMGPASMSIALHELLLMCQQANVINLVTIIRFGTCEYNFLNL